MHINCRTNDAHHPTEHTLRAHCLQVHLDRVVLDVTAVPGPGNLLGNLLCAIAGLLDGVDLGGVLGNLLQQLIDALIRLLQGLGGGGAATPSVPAS